MRAEWDYRKWKCNAVRFHVLQDSVTHVGFNHDGTYAATGDMAGLIQVWKLMDPEPVWSEKVEDLQVSFYYTTISRRSG